MQITAKSVKELRDRTGAGMVNCKEALKECGGDVEKAVDYLRKKGLASAGNRSGRATGQGVVMPVISGDRRTAAMVEVNCETDFVAKTDDFQNFARKLAELALSDSSVTCMEDLKTKTLEGASVEEQCKLLISKTGENITLNRAARFAVPEGKNGCLEIYVHGNGAIGVVVEGESGKAETWNNSAAVDILHECALQIAGMTPLYVSSKDVPSSAIDRERSVITGQIQNEENAKKAEDGSYKPKNEATIAKIVEGRLNKFLADVTLMNQVYFKENKTTMETYISEASKPLNDTVTVTSFKRWQRGEASSEESAPSAQAEAGA